MSIKIITDSEDCSKNIIDSRNETRISNLEEDRMIWKHICNSTFKTIESNDECEDGWDGKFVKLSVNNKTSSPSFNIINEYKDNNKKTIYHLDLYRLKSINDLVEIGFEEYINSGNYCFIEWPEIADSFFVDKYININISINSENSRDIDITFH